MTATTDVKVKPSNSDSEPNGKRSGSCVGFRRCFQYDLSSVKDHFPGVFEIHCDQISGNGLYLSNSPIRSGRIDHELTRFQKSVEDMHCHGIADRHRRRLPCGGFRLPSRSAGPAQAILLRERFKRVLKVLTIGFIMLARSSNFRARICFGFADDFRGRSERQGAVGDNLSLRYKGTSTYEAVHSDLRAVQDRCIHSDQGVFADYATMQHSFVTDRAPRAYFDRKPRIGMENAMFLNVAAFANDDRFIVAANRCSEPDGYAAFNDDVADHAGVRRNPEFASFWQLRF